MLLMTGKEVAAAVQNEIASAVETLKKDSIALKLAIVIVGDDPAAHAYKNRMVKLAESLRIATDVTILPADIQMSELFTVICNLNKDPNVTGILPMMPLPKHLNPRVVADAIGIVKDVDCLNIQNIGELYSTNGQWAPCTPRAVMAVLDYYKIPLSGKHAVVIGRSNVVGKPLANLLLAQNATVTVCHSRTTNIAEITKQADIIVAAVGVPAFVTADMVKEGAVVVDVGINLVDGKLVGDVEPAVAEKAGAFTPVPGGIGTVTTTMMIKALLRNYL